MKKKLLLHSCCAPCSTVVIDRLKKKYDITVIFFNPNISPAEEHEKRKAEQVKYLENHLPEVKVITFDYDSLFFDRAVEGLESDKEGGGRCKICIYIRLSRTAQYAKENGFDIFATTLTVGPKKDSVMINNIGRRLEKPFEVEFLNEDFKKRDGFLKSVQMSKDFDIYRQNYCGCKFSLKDK
jgi:hypothetical protein